MDLITIACIVAVVVGIVGVLLTRGKSSGPSASDIAPIKPPPPREDAHAAETSNLIPLHAYYGSQTGTAEGFAKQISNEAKRHGFKATVFDLENFDADKFVATREQDAGSGQAPVAVFVMATYGEGDPTDNAIQFTKWLKDAALPADLLTGLRFCVFGLGNRQYEHFNAMGRLVNQRMTELGATAVYKYGEGDDDGTLEEDFDAWKEGLWPGLANDLGIAGGGASGGAGGASDVISSLPELSWSLHWIATPDATHASPDVIFDAARAKLAKKAIEVDLSSKHYFTAKSVTVTLNRELRQAPSFGSSTKHVEIDLSGSGLHYGTADDLAVLPENLQESVNALAKWLGYDKDLDRWFTLERAPGSEGSAKSLFPTPCTLRTALTCYVDLQGAPRKQLLSYLAVLASNSEQKRRLQHLASSEGKEDYKAWVIDQQRSILEVFQEFPSVQPSPEQLLQLLPPLAPRWYTIASSSVAHPNSVHLAVSLVQEEKVGPMKGRLLMGVCSNYLGAAPAGAVIRCDLRASNFKLPQDTKKPVIMVGPGTGIAPMRAFLQERKFQREQGCGHGPFVLFFGCRRSDEDYIYKDELEGYLEDGTLSQLVLAFSRQQKSKVYVQHKLKENAKQVWEYLHDEGGYLFVCGSTQMGEDVKHAIHHIAMEQGGLSESAASAWIKEIHDRYIVELW